jgi:DNA-nicking Smr family endonuclease
MKNGHHNKPFRHLKKLLQAHDIGMEDMPAERLPAGDRQELTPQQEDALFRHAMQDVHRMTPVKTAQNRPQEPLARSHPNEEEDVLAQLQRLVECGRGYRVADTPEYIEGRGLDVPREMTRRLHRCAFSIQDHLDLHGLGVLEAQEAVDRFLRNAVRRGLRTILIIHGRGLSSPGEPVLKSRLVQWLNRGKWRKWVLAYTSARHCDGGVGATYVLLRHRRPNKRLQLQYNWKRPS